MRALVKPLLLFNFAWKPSKHNLKFHHTVSNLQHALSSSSRPISQWLKSRPNKDIVNMDLCFCFILFGFVIQYIAALSLLGKHRFYRNFPETFFLLMYPKLNLPRQPKLITWCRASPGCDTLTSRQSWHIPVTQLLGAVWGLQTLSFW